MTHDELAISLGYSSEKDWDEKLSDEQYKKQVYKQMKMLTCAYYIGSCAWDNKVPDESIVKKILCQD